MLNSRLIYMPLLTYPDVVPNEAVTAAVAFAPMIGCELHVTTFAVNFPNVYSPLDGLFLSIPEIIGAAEQTSQANCRRLEALVHNEADKTIRVESSSKTLGMGMIEETVASDARYFDIALFPWAKDLPVVQDVVQAVIFDSGRPVILVPQTENSGPIEHMAVAWDGTRAAARALADAMPLMTEHTRITVLTIQGEKELARVDLAESLATSLRRRGFQAQAHTVTLDQRPIAEVLQESALAMGANLLVMGGFGHSRIRDFVLGGATKGVFADLRIPVLFSH
ncbi:universal stress protein [Advenella sp. FME57]|uniref:universal stress protein n=1 Tax=Advenella sp. FME57 TaxID=2742604 RepID=UPI001867AE20|nr:universal stress protein [Advenella sp. FME57]